MKYIYFLYFGLLFSIPISSAQDRQFDSTINAALKEGAAANKIPYYLLKAVCSKESSLDPEAKNKYDKGGVSHGLCQLQEKTAREVGFRGRISRLYNPYVNAFFAAKYLHNRIHKYDGDWIKGISAYNGGLKKRQSKYVVTNWDYVHDVFSRIVPND